MNPDIIADYVKKVYGYAVNHSYDCDEADELAQEILFCAVRELPKLQDEDKFEPWLWGIAGNVTKSFRRSLGKQRAMYSYDTLETLSYEDTYFDEQEELYDTLRTKIAMLSSIYRNIIILHYYDGLSTKIISETLQIPEGTVRWRLTEARRKLKKECAEMETTALKPVQLHVDIYGNGNYNGKTIPFPSVYVNDALSQNILYHCYEQPQSVEELAKRCGVPAYYIEERIENLVKREAILECTKGKYQTNFIIWSDKHGIYYEENAEKALMPMMEKLLHALQAIAKETAELDFYRAEKREEDLFYLYGVMAFMYAVRKYCPLLYPEIPQNYDGFAWRYIGTVETGKHPVPRIGEHRCSNFGRYGKGRFCHCSYHGIPGMTLRDVMYDVSVCEDLLCGGKTVDIDSAATVIKEGYIEKRPNGSLFVTIPFFNSAQITAFDAIADKYMKPLMPEYSEIIKRFIAGYKKLFPTHLHDDVDRMCHHTFFGMYAVVIGYAQRTCAIPMPSAGSHCDVLIQDIER